MQALRSRRGPAPSDPFRELLKAIPYASISPQEPQTAAVRADAGYKSFPQGSGTAPQPWATRQPAVQPPDPPDITAGRDARQCQVSAARHVETQIGVTCPGTNAGLTIGICNHRHIPWREPQAGTKYRPAPGSARDEAPAVFREDQSIGSGSFGGRKDADIRRQLIQVPTPEVDFPLGRHLGTHPG